jgi:hypothetical protein
LSLNNTAEDNAQLCINYCDKNTIQVDFKQITNGVELFDFTEYEGKFTSENRAYVEMEYTDEYGTTKPGYIEIAMFMDNIWVSVYSNDGITFLNSQMEYNADTFNPFKSPFSYKVGIELNGAAQTFDKKPFIINGTTYVPLRGVLDAMNLNVYWDEVQVDKKLTQLITTTRNNTILQFRRANTGKGYSQWSLSEWDSDHPDTHDAANGKIDISTHQPLILDGTTYIPLRIISEAYGASVEWNGLTSTVSISENIASDTKKTSDELTAVQQFTKTSADKTAVKYAGMKINDYIPYYTYKSKYFIYEQEGKLYKLNYDGSIE